MREGVDNDSPGAPLQDRQQAMSQWHIALIKMHGGAELALERATAVSSSTRNIELTEAGQIYFDRCKRIVEEARLAHEQLGEMLARPSGELRASLPVDFANIYLAPLIAQFARLYPGISFDFDLTPRQVDLVSEPVDVVIRMDEPASSNLIARKLASLRRGLYASPRYRELFGDPVHPTDLTNHECLRLPECGLIAGYSPAVTRRWRLRWAVDSNSTAWA